VTDTEPEPRTARRAFLRELASGIAAVVFLLWLTFFGTEGFVELATLAAAVVILIWFSTVEPARLMDSPRQPSVMLFMLAVLGFAVVLTAALIIGTGTLLFVALLTLISIGIGFARAVGHRFRQPIRGDDGVS
jgi:uncharacterized membrane protein